MPSGSDRQAASQAFLEPQSEMADKVNDKMEAYKQDKLEEQEMCIRDRNNKNRIVIGPSGSGKSFWLNNYILQSYELGRDVMIIDIGKLLRKLKRFLSVEFVDQIPP